MFSNAIFALFWRGKLNGDRVVGVMRWDKAVIDTNNSNIIKLKKEPMKDWRNRQLDGINMAISSSRALKIEQNERTKQLKNAIVILRKQLTKKGIKIDE